MRREKQLLLDDIKEKIEGANALILTKYTKLSPDLSNQFRLSLAAVGGGFAVVKKNILMKAAAESGIQLEPDLLEGHIGIMFAHKDPISSTKVLFQFAKEHENTLEVLAGQFDGQLCNASDVQAISELPSQDEMRAQFLGLLEAPMAQTLSTMEALLTSIMHCLENKSKI